MQIRADIAKKVAPVQRRNGPFQAGFSPFQAGIALWNFWGGLVLLGVGWNFSFIGATTMVTHCHTPKERNKVQAFNDFLVFGSMTLASFSSGQLLESFGWEAVNYVVFPVILAAGALLAWRKLQERPVAA